MMLDQKRTAGEPLEINEEARKLDETNGQFNWHEERTNLLGWDMKSEGWIEGRSEAVVGPLATPPNSTAPITSNHPDLLVWLNRRETDDEKPHRFFFGWKRLFY